LDTERREASRYFRKKKACLETKIEEHETKTKIEDIRESIILIRVTRQVTI